MRFFFCSSSAKHLVNRANELRWRGVLALRPRVEVGGTIVDLRGVHAVRGPSKRLFNTALLFFFPFFFPFLFFFFFLLFFWDEEKASRLCVILFGNKIR